MRKTPTKKPAAAPRETIVSRSTMSHAFEAAVRGLIAEGPEAGAQRRELGLAVASSLDTHGTRKRPAWRVSKKGGR